MLSKDGRRVYIGQSRGVIVAVDRDTLQFLDAVKVLCSVIPATLHATLAVIGKDTFRMASLLASPATLSWLVLKRGHSDAASLLCGAFMEGKLTDNYCCGCS